MHRAKSTNYFKRDVQALGSTPHVHTRRMSCVHNQGCKAAAKLRNTAEPSLRKSQTKPWDPAHICFLIKSWAVVNSEQTFYCCQMYHDPLIQFCGPQFRKLEEGGKTKTKIKAKPSRGLGEHGDQKPQQEAEAWVECGFLPGMREGPKAKPGSGACSYG